MTMRIKWLGHSSFVITSRDNIKIVTDPYTPGMGLNYHPINESADIVTKSHDHLDHNNTRAVKGNPVVLSEAGLQTIKGVDFKAIPVFHDESAGSQRGRDLVFCFKIDGVNLCHLGDLGHRLNYSQVSEIGQVDILFIPVGGYFTIDAKAASDVARSLNPKLVFPMHYKTPKDDYPITGVDEFLRDKKYVLNIKTSEFEVKKENLPQEAEIVVLQPAN
jgi:L-ascorbate metabolism protein UlaG (beta-lactamase superfamily)